jgi:D-alanyl-lipoteichoic acid acyltransferase DltB (MBOAT superfamily)
VLPFPHNVVLVAIGGGLVGVCHLPAPFSVRVGLLLLIGSGLALVRGGWLQGLFGGVEQVVLPVLAAMFMFRLAIYLYDLRHEKKPATVAERLSYFFMLPNAVFLLFPVVDYQTYRRTYYNADARAIYQKGILWMMRGVTHLLLYRVVYLYLTPAAGDVQGVATVMQFAVTSYALYLRISGQFHLIVGILCLFGFNLPETHHQYFLASGFTDFWRRINIYWKDFMMKMVYYPVFVPLHRRVGMAGGIALATVAVFAGTWVLHSYQWFWLRGTFPIAAPDGLFWGFLGVMVIFTSLREAAGKKSKKSAVLNVRVAAARASSTVAFFVMMSLLWSLWSTPSLRSWWEIVSKAGQSGIGEFAWLAAAVIAAIAIGTALQLVPRAHPAAAREPLASRLRHPAVQVAVTASLLIVVSLPYVRSAFGSGPRAVVVRLLREQLNRADQEAADRGYYEGLLDHRHFASALWSARGGVLSDDVAIENAAIVRKRMDLLEYELKPSFAGTFKNAPFSTNRWGMRGGDYALSKAPATFRIALVGASYEMAGGVNDDQTFAALLEDRLNEGAKDGGPRRFEVLNFSVSGYSMIHKAIIAEDRVAPFDPDLVLLTVYSTEQRRLLSHLVRIVEREVSIPYSDLQRILARSGVRSGMESRQIRERLEPHVSDVIEWSFAKIKADCAARGLRIALLALPTTTDDGSDSAQKDLDRIVERAVRAGIEPLRLAPTIYGGREMKDLQLSLRDSHLNVLGNTLFAHALLELLRKPEHRLLVPDELIDALSISRRAY